ncbi:lysozyme inhibitor LprI family protein [Pseudaminobacter salicylatoxidans]|uniref:lysozyme inhibitor LprI family protein n=1 Tax=Pseudaminobacter salicylatoxidans TaxID=93369 RepID=UPI0002FF005D|nr:lysozyme inhibitor LprI family protein [Pseudaminobacter salicylatoxidans]
MSFVLRSLLLTVPLLMTNAAVAQVQPGCSDASDQASLNQCADKAYKKTDAALNAIYKEIMGRLKDDKDTRKRLVTAQQAWIKFRDAECDFATGNSLEGSIYPMLVLNCRNALTHDRLEQLKGYLKCEEGDLSCPVPPK